MPGSADVGMVDAAALQAWVREARALCVQAGREAVGDLHIGQILAAAPAERGGAWPAIAVREVIENTQSRELERGILDGRAQQQRRYLARHDGWGRAGAGTGSALQAMRRRDRA